MKIFLILHFSAKMLTAVYNINLQLFNDKLIRVKRRLSLIALRNQTDKEDY